MTRPLTIAIYLPDLSGGGAERSQINLAQFFLHRCMSVEFVLDRAEGPLLAAVPAGATVVSLKSARVLQSLPRLVRYLRERQPDILLSNLGHNNVIALWAQKLARSGAKIVVCQHSVLSSENASGRFKHRLLPLLYRLFLPWADGIVAVSQGVATDMAQVAKLPISKITIIYNGVVTYDFEAKARMPLAHPWFGDAATDVPVFVSVGRLDDPKDFPSLLRAFAKVVATRPARLVIVGEGPHRHLLSALIAELGIGNKVDLVGYQHNPLPFMRHAELVILSSRYEGFAIVLAEALACGTKAVSTDCPYGPGEILDHGTYGVLVPVSDPAALAEGVLTALNSSADKAKLKIRSREFSMEICGNRYLDLFERIRAVGYT
jgi:glycosyltransferase involved in cell wall biosynthesis